jgi:hypothetical protein
MFISGTGQMARFPPNSVVALPLAKRAATTAATAANHSRHVGHYRPNKALYCNLVRIHRTIIGPVL